MEGNDILTQCKYQEALDSVASRIPEIDCMLICFITKDDEFTWRACSERDADINWMVDIVKQDILKGAYKDSE